MAQMTASTTVPKLQTNEMLVSELGMPQCLDTNTEGQDFFLV